jgi:hypothetical protein
MVVGDHFYNKLDVTSRYVCPMIPVREDWLTGSALGNRIKN